MDLSLDNWLRTGEFGDLRFGMAKDEVTRLLGPPDDFGNTSRKYREPSIFLYGTVELWFQQQKPNDLTGIYWEPGAKGAFKLTPICRVLDWALVPGLTIPEVQGYLLARELPFAIAQQVIVDSSTLLTLASGVHIQFDNEAELWSISSMLNRLPLTASAKAKDPNALPVSR